MNEASSVSYLMLLNLTIGKVTAVGLLKKTKSLLVLINILIAVSKISIKKHLYFQYKNTHILQLNTDRS